MTTATATADVADLLKQIQTEVKAARDEFHTKEAARVSTFEELRSEIAKGSKTSGDVEQKIARIAEDATKSAEKIQSLEQAINELAKKVQRPAGDDTGDKNQRDHAIQLLEAKHFSRVTKRDNEHPFTYTEDQVAEAQIAIKALKTLINTSSIQELPEQQRKALSTFNLGTSGFLLAPEMSSQVLSCVEDPTDVLGLFANLNISGPSVKFMVDNERWDVAAWACESQCFANNPTQQLGEGLGEVEIKPEALRYIICTTRELLEDANINIEAWLLNKVNRSFRNHLSMAMLIGDGIGKPLGILTPSAGVPVCDTGSVSPAGQFTWQDLILLKYQVPSAFAGGGAYLMNQNTFGLALTMSDAMGRPIMLASPLAGGQYLVGGSSVVIASQMPDVAPGATPVAYGNWKQAYMVVNRRAVTMTQDPYSAGFCVLFKFEARIGGAPICPNAARLLRIG